MRGTVSPTREALHDLGLALAVGGTWFGKFHLDPSVKVLPARPERGRLITSAWGTFLLTDAIGLGLGISSWLRQRTGLLRGWGASRRRSLVRAKDVLLGTSVLAIAANAVCAVVLLRAAHGPDIPVETGLTPAPEATPEMANLQRAMVATSFAHMLAAGGALALSAPLRSK